MGPCVVNMGYLRQYCIILRVENSTGHYICPRAIVCEERVEVSRMEDEYVGVGLFEGLRHGLAGC